MLDSRVLGVGTRFHGLPGAFYTTTINVFRPTATGGSPNSGFLGEPTASGQVTMTQIAVNYPATIFTPKTSVLTQTDAGLTEKATYRMVCPFLRFAVAPLAGTLVVQARDVIVNNKSGERFLVINSHDPSDTRVEIMADLEQGPEGGPP